MLADGAIGGYFPLEDIRSGPGLPADVLGFQSARAAFLALLRHVKPARVWLPRYLCPAMLRAVRKAGAEPVLYPLREDFSPIGVLAAPADLVLMVDYFGLTDEVVTAAVRSFGPERVVVDAAQSWAVTADALAKVFSLRKFRPLPDGALLYTEVPVALPEAMDQGSLRRCLPMLRRANGQVEAGYADYRAAEESLDDMEPLRMSWITAALASADDHSGSFWKRRSNYGVLASRLGDLVSRVLPVGEYAPLCFPLIGVDALRLRPLLTAQRVYTPTYWPDIIDVENLNEFELTLRDRTLYLPIDQRYGPEDMARLASIVRDLVQNNARSV